MERLTRDELFISIAETVAMRSTCLRGQVGCVIVKDKHIVSMGYNGAPPGQPHCTDVGCGGGIKGDFIRMEGGIPVHEVDYPNGCTRSTHAEMNAVAFAARQGIPCARGTMYCTHCMCANCAAAVVAAGITRVVYVRPYRLTGGLELLRSCGLVVEQFNGTRSVQSEEDHQGLSKGSDGGGV